MRDAIRVIFLDLDGTLVGENDTISPRNLLALREARHAGCTPVICTGRTRYTSKKVVERLGNSGYGIFLNGATLWNLETDTLVHKTRLPANIADCAAMITHEHGLAPFCFAADEDDRWIYVDRDSVNCPNYIRESTERLVYCNNLLSEMPDMPASIETYGPPDIISQITDAWNAAMGGAVMTYIWPENGGAYMGAHIHSSGASKAAAAQTVCDLLGVTREQAVAVGDQVNDVEMLRWAGIGVAMGDARPEVIEAANHVTASFTDDGAAQAIERFVLRRS